MQGKTGDQPAYVTCNCAQADRVKLENVRDLVAQDAKQAKEKPKQPKTEAFDPNELMELKTEFRVTVEGIGSEDYVAHPAATKIPRPKKGQYAELKASVKA
jgi:hypothetical protein